MYASKIHAYFAQIGLDPVIGWEILETILENPTADVVDTKHLRRILADAIVTYTDMAHDDEDASTEDSSFFLGYVLPLLRSTLPLTLHEQYAILGSAAWWGASLPMVNQVRIAVKRQVLPPKDA
jgi:hypothetical protein